MTRRRDAVSVSGMRQPGRDRRRGLTLVELLIAAALASGMLASAWGWLWTSAAAARRVDFDAQAATAQAFAARRLRADLSSCAGLCPPELGVCGPSRLALLRRDPVTGDQEVTVVAWDPGRRVLWRNAAGSYLADDVTAFAVRYFSAAGAELLPVDGVLGLEEREAARRVAACWTSGCGQVRVEVELP